jgi:hypothetical protein
VKKYLPLIVTLLVAVVLAFAVGRCTAATAPTSIWNWQDRSAVSANAGYLVLNQTGETDRWWGADLGIAGTYSLTAPSLVKWEPRFALYAMYDHGFPLTSGHAQNNQINLGANLGVYPGPSDQPGKLNLFLGGGAIWYGIHTIREFEGWDVHVTGTWDFAKPLVGFAKYAHDFRQQAVAGVSPADKDQIKVGLNFLLWR